MAQTSLNPEQRALATFAGSNTSRDLTAYKTAAVASNLIHKIDLALDRAIVDLQRRAPVKAACQAGCCHCCHYAVYVTIPELCAIVDHIEAHYSAQEREALKARIEAYERIVAPLMGRNLASVRPVCPLLVDGKCSVYAVRPLRCRGISSVDAGICARRCEHPQDQVPIPAVRGQLETSRAVASGVASGLAKVGIFVDHLDLGRALGIALTEPHACQRFLDGDPVLMPALLGTDSPRRSGPPLEEIVEPGATRDELARHYELFALGHHAEAMDALTSNHPAAWLRRLAVPEFYDSEEEIDQWRASFRAVLDRIAEIPFDPAAAYRALPLLHTSTLAYHQRNDRELLSRFGDVLFDRISARLTPDLAEPNSGPRKPGPPRVGYIGTYLTNSNGGYWSLGWLKNHPKEFETFAFFLGDVADDVTQQFRRHATHFFQPKGDPLEFARYVRSLDLDLLIYPEIGLSARNYRYAIFRLARAQATAWGHPVTSGLPTIDFYLSSELMEPPNGQDHYREKLIRLGGSGLVYSRKRTPISSMVRADFGLDDGPLILSCQNPMKHTPRWDGLYAQVSRATGRPIVFLEGVGHDVALLKQRMDRAGVRARWIPTLRAPEFLALLRLADVVLDSPGWNGGNTTIQALDLRRPVVSLEGDTMRGRHAAAFLTQANAPGLLARTPAQYVQLASDPKALAHAMASATPEALFEDLSPMEVLNGLIRSCAVP